MLIEMKNLECFNFVINMLLGKEVYMSIQWINKRIKTPTGLVVREDK